MKKYLIIAAALSSLCLNSFASPLDSRTALARALGEMPFSIRNSNKDPWKSSGEIKRDGQPALYLFSAADKFLVASGDSNAPALLGYSYENPFDIDGEIAPACRFWLDFLADRIAALPEKDERGMAIPKNESIEMEKIAPMVSTKWSQDAPYYDLCPKIRDVQTYTGCVATAMAQTMKYHNWPLKGEGENSYKWSTATLSMDFSTCDFRYEEMLNEYKKDEYTEAQGLAVAELMYAAGIAVNMSFGTGGSGASSLNIAPALGKYFKYDKENLRFLKREYYCLEEWQNIIYTSLKNDGPVIYDGQSYQGGHSFICDGYDGYGYFHFNWGWGGVSDGYFLLDALDPYEQGIGGSASNSGFNFSQDIIVGIRPDRSGNEGVLKGSLIASASFLLDEETEFSIDDSFELGFPEYGIVYNAGPGSIPPNLIVGLKFTPTTEGEEYYSMVMSETEVPLGYGFSGLTLSFDEEMADGEYIATMICAMEDDEEVSAIPVPVYDSPGYHVRVSDGKVKFTEISPVVLESLSLTFPDEIEKLEITGKEKVFTAIAQVENPSEKPVYSYISCLILNDVDYKCAEGLSMVVDFAPGETKEVIYSSPFTKTLSFKLKPGIFKYVLCQETSTSYIPFAEKTIRIVDNLSDIEEIASEEDSSEPIEVYDITGHYLGTMPALPVDASKRTFSSSGIRIFKKGSQTVKTLSR